MGISASRHRRPESVQVAPEPISEPVVEVSDVIPVPQKTPEEEELEAINLQVNDAAFTGTDYPEYEERRESLSEEEGLTALNGLQFDTFIARNGKPYSCFRHPEKKKWYFIDWNKQNQLPNLLPESWKKDGSFSNPSNNISSRAILSSRFEKTIDLPPVDNPHLKDSSVSIISHSGSYIISQVFHTHRSVRYMFSPSNQMWLQMPLDVEIQLPETKQLIRIICDLIMRDYEIEWSELDNEKVLLALRDCNYSPERVMRWIQRGAPYALSSLKTRTSNSESHLEKIGRDSAVSLFHKDMSNTSNQVVAFSAHIAQLESKILDQAIMLENAAQTSQAQTQEIATLRAEILKLRQQAAPMNRALLKATEAYESERNESLILKREVESMRMLRLDMVSDFPKHVVNQKDAHINDLVHKITALQTRVWKLEDWRRRKGHELVEALNGIQKIRIDFIALRQTVTRAMSAFSLQKCKILELMTARLAHDNNAIQRLQLEVLAQQKANQVLKKKLNDARGGMNLLCSLKQKKTGILYPKISIFGESTVIYANADRRFKVGFDRVTCEPEPVGNLYQESIRPSILGLAEGLSVSLILCDDVKPEHNLSFERYLYLATDDIFGVTDGNFAISLICLEFYSEKVYDLLSKSSSDMSIVTSTANQLKLKPDPSKYQLLSKHGLNSFLDQVSKKLHSLHHIYGFSSSTATQLLVMRIQKCDQTAGSILESTLVMISLPDLPSKTMTSSQDLAAAESNESITKGTASALERIKEYVSISQTYRVFTEFISRKREGQAGGIVMQRNSILWKLLATGKYGDGIISDTEDSEDVGSVMFVIFGVDSEGEDASYNVLKFAEQLKSA